MNCVKYSGMEYPSLYDIHYTTYIQVNTLIHLPLTDVIAVDSDWLPLFVPNMCTFSKPLDEPTPSYDHTTGTIKCHMAATYGKQSVDIMATLSSLCGL